MTFCKVVRKAARTGRQFVGRRFMQLRVVMDMKNGSGLVKSLEQDTNRDGSTSNVIQTFNLSFITQIDWVCLAISGFWGWQVKLKMKWFWEKLHCVREEILEKSRWNPETLRKKKRSWELLWRKEAWSNPVFCRCLIQVFGSKIHGHFRNFRANLAAKRAISISCRMQNLWDAGGARLRVLWNFHLLFF